MHMFQHLPLQSLCAIVFFQAVFSVSPIQAQTAIDVENQNINCDGRQIFTEQGCVGDGIEPEEQKLYEMVNAYRKKHHLPAIPLSPALSLVANRHVIDLDQNIGDLTHSWSDCNKG